MKILIAIDGPAASGKGTVSAKIAEHFGIEHLDTGKIYRALGAKIIATGTLIFDEKKIIDLASHITLEDLKQPGLNAENVSLMTSMVAAKPQVRQTLLEFQRNFAANPKGALLEGRDIGTVICPEAPFKFFITADLEERAQRRFKQLQEEKQNVAYEDVLESLRLRDERDANRSNAPMKAADDAMIIDTTKMTREEVINLIIQTIENKIANL